MVSNVNACYELQSKENYLLVEFFLTLLILQASESNKEERAYEIPKHCHEENCITQESQETYCACSLSCSCIKFAASCPPNSSPKTSPGYTLKRENPQSLINQLKNEFNVVKYYHIGRTISEFLFNLKMGKNGFGMKFIKVIEWALMNFWRNAHSINFSKKFDSNRMCISIFNCTTT